ncbi:MAG: hypothetical protein JSV04_03125 [Candidatus Heimdallarchaeota archaeon]|nr:MAG: hypothetical protein JSV04_03125 [Candidatus Heimdallarchaeota archaeon]
MSPNFKSLSPELTGMWSSREKSNFEKDLLGLFWVSTGVIILLIFVETISLLGLVPVAAFLISCTIILTLEIYTAQSKYPYITIPVSQVVIILVASYLQFYRLFSLQSGILESPNFPLLPDLLGIVLGIVILLRAILGLGIIRLSRCYQNARVPLSRYPQESLATFESNLQLVSSEVRREFREESPQYGIGRLLLFVLFCITLLIVLLIPLWLNIVLNIIVYPYIVLIPVILGILVLIVFFPPKIKETTPE